MDNISDSEREIRAAMDRLNERENEIKITDEFFKMPPDHWESKGIKEENGIMSRLKILMSILMPIVLLAVIVLCAAAIFLWKDVGAMKTSLNQLNSKINSIDTAGVKSQLVVVETKVEHMAKENEKLKNEIAKLNDEIETLKAKKEKQEVYKQPAKKKKPAATVQQKQR